MRIRAFFVSPPAMDIVILITDASSLSSRHSLRNNSLQHSSVLKPHSGLKDGLSFFPFLHLTCGLNRLRNSSRISHGIYASPNDFQAHEPGEFHDARWESVTGRRQTTLLHPIRGICHDATFARLPCLYSLATHGILYFCSPWYTCCLRYS